MDDRLPHDVLDVLLAGPYPASIASLTQTVDAAPGDITTAVYELLDDGLAMQDAEGISASWAARQGARPRRT